MLGAGSTDLFQTLTQGLTGAVPSHLEVVSGNPLRH
jgi:hypothetical protein